MSSNNLAHLFLQQGKRLLENRNLESVFRDVEIFMAMIVACVFGHKSMSKATVTIVLLSLLYVISPIDVIPDFIPIVGYLDDIFVVRLVSRQLHQELRDFQQWRQDHPDVELYTLNTRKSN